MGAFDGLRDATRGYSSNPLRKGRYVVRIDSCDHFTSDQKGEMWKNTLTVLGVISGDHQVGEQVHTYFKVGDTPVKKRMFQQNLKAFLAGVLGVADEQIGADEAKLAASEQSPMRGLVTIVSANEQTHKTRRDDDGNPIRYTIASSWSRMLDPQQIIDAIGEENVARFFPKGL